MLDMQHLFDLQFAVNREANRRKILLGSLAGKEYDFQVFFERSRATGIPLPFIVDWNALYSSAGSDGLAPTDWQPLDEKSQLIAFDLYQSILPFADYEILTARDIADLATLIKRSYRTAERRLQRYRIGGLWGLVPAFNPLRRSANPTDESRTSRDLAALDDATLNEIYRRRDLLGPLATDSEVSDVEVEQRAKEVGSSRSTLWAYRKAYLSGGLSALAPKTRSDAGKPHKISSQVEALVFRIRMSNPDWSARAVFEMAHQKAIEAGEIPPSLAQVRRILNMIPRHIRLCADGRFDQFRNSSRFTGPMRFTGVIYQIDINYLDVKARDIRDEEYRTESGETRIYYVAAIDAQSRCLIAARFSYDRPNEYMVGALIRDCLLAKPGGVPDEIWVDNGMELVSRYVEEITRDLGILLHRCPPGQPQIRGIIERFFKTVNTRLWSLLRGYVSSNPTLRNPRAEGWHIIRELAEKFQDFCAMYNAEEHSSLGISPLEYWTANCFAGPVPNAHDLDLLLLRKEVRKVTKSGIHYGGRKFWHMELGEIVLESVLLRVDAQYGTPDEVEVYHDGRWLCTAFALDSERGRNITREEIASAQRNQMTSIRSAIDSYRSGAEAIEQRIALLKASQLTDAPLPGGSENVELTPDHGDSNQGETSVSMPKPAKDRKPEGDLLTLAAARNWDQSQEE